MSPEKKIASGENQKLFARLNGEDCELHFIITDRENGSASQTWMVGDEPLTIVQEEPLGESTLFCSPKLANELEQKGIVKSPKDSKGRK